MQIKSLCKVKSNIYDAFAEMKESAYENTFRGPRNSQGDFVHVPIKWNFILLVKEVDPADGIENIHSYE